MTDLQTPLTAPECDCRGLPFMPLDVARLRESDLAALSTGDEFKAAILLWCASWNQVPAASLPDDERILSRLAMCSLNKWRKVATVALRGWVKCSDGRIYHPTVSEKASEAFSFRTKQRERVAKRWKDEKSLENNEPSNTTVEPRNNHGTSTVIPGTGTGTYSEAKASADRAAWSAAIHVLTEAGLSDKAARSFFAGLLARHRLHANDLSDAIAEADANGTQEPRGFLTAAAKNRQRALDPKERDPALYRIF